MRRQSLAFAVLIVIIAAVAGCSGGVSDTAAPTIPVETVSAPTAATTVAPTAADTATGSDTGMAVSADAVAKGQDVFTGFGGCSACHAIDGVAHGVLGPELNGVATLAETRIPGYTAEQYLRESIVDSCAFTVPDTDCNLMLSVMNTITLSDGEVDALVAFLLQQR